MAKKTQYLLNEAYNLGYEDGREDQRRISITKEMLMEIVKDQREALIKKACKWFQKLWEEDYVFIDDRKFREAMED